MIFRVTLRNIYKKSVKNIVNKAREQISHYRAELYDLKVSELERCRRLLDDLRGLPERLAGPHLAVSRDHLGSRLPASLRLRCLRNILGVRGKAEGRLGLILPWLSGAVLATSRPCCNGIIDN